MSEHFRRTSTDAEAEAEAKVARRMMPSLTAWLIGADRRLMTRHRHLRALLVIYLAVVVFAAGFTLLWWITILRPGLMPPLSRNELLAAAALLAAPVLVAAVWDRLSSVRLAGVEISLVNATQPVEINFPRNLQNTEALVLGGPEIPDIKVAIKTSSPLVQVSLDSSRSWWSTRLHLLAALAQDFAVVRYLLFVEDRARSETYYLGMATPAAVRVAMARLDSKFEAEYRKARAAVRPHADPEQEVKAVLGLLSEGMKAGGMHEEAMKQFVTASDLAVWLGGDLIFAAEEWIGPEDTLLRYLLVDKRAPFVAIVRNGQLERVVDRCDLATLIAKQALGTMLRS